MAYVQDPNDPNLQQGAGGAPGAPGVQPPQTSGGTSGNATVGGTPQGAAAVPNTSKAPPVQDLKAYLEANAPQSVQMGQKIAGNLDQTAQKVTGDVNAGQQTVDQTVQASHVTPNADLVTAAAANPADFVSSPDNVTAFTKQRDANYAGPATFESTPESSALTAEVTDAMSKAPDISNTAGIQQLVTGQETNPTLGMENLDTLLLQGNPEAMAPIQASIPGIKNLGKYLSGVGTTENAAIQKAIADNLTAKAGVQTAFNGPTGAAPKFKSGMDQKLQDAIAKTTAYNKGVNDLIPAENDAKTQFQNLESIVGGYNSVIPNMIEQYATPITPLSYKQPTNPNPVNLPTLPGVASPQDIQTEKALEALLGGGYSPAFDTAGATPFNAPGAAPTLQELENPSIQDLIAQITGRNPYIYEKSPFGNGGLMTVPYGTTSVEDAITALQTKLGETPYAFPAIPTTPDPYNPQIPGPVTPGNVVHGGGNTYIDPVTGETKIAY